MECDDLCQRAADNSTARHAALLDAIAISAEAVRMGKGAVGKVAEHIHYGANTVRKLAVMEELPPELVDLDAKPGMYWVALMNADDPIAAIRQALAENVTTPAGMKKLLGLEEPESDSGKWVNEDAAVFKVQPALTPETGVYHGYLLTLYLPDWQPAPDAPEQVRVTG